MTKHIYNYTPDIPDFRDRYLFRRRLTPIDIPDAIDMRPLMTPVEDQGNLGSCHDASTEVLTDEGWRLFADLKGDEPLATVDPETGRLSYEKPARLVRFAYVGPMIVGKTRSLDFKVTPDHKMLVRRWDERSRTLSSRYELVEAKRLGWYFGLMNRIRWDGGHAAVEYVLPGCGAQA